MGVVGPVPQVQPLWGSPCRTTFSVRGVCPPPQMPPRTCAAGRGTGVRGAGGREKDLRGEWGSALAQWARSSACPRECSENRVRDLRRKPSSINVIY